MQRRRFIQTMVGSAVAAFFRPFPLSAMRLKQQLRFPPILDSSHLRAAVGTVATWENTLTQAYTLNGAFPSPTIIVQSGDTVSLELLNALEDDFILHWHGLIVPWQMDGHPLYQIAPSESYRYQFPVRQRAGTYMYHAHTLHRTAEQTYRGIGGFFIVHDEEELNLGLPYGEFDIPLVLQDRRSSMDRDVFTYAPFPRDVMTGYMGDTVFVNGTADAQFAVHRTWYRFRLMNASNARIYRIAFDPEIEFFIIGTDGGLLDVPREASEFFLAPGERVEIMVNFAPFSISSSIMMKSTEFQIDLSPMSDQGRPLDVLELIVVGEQQSNGSLPNILSSFDRYRPEDALRVRIFELSMFMAQPQINGVSYSLSRIDEMVPVDELEIWEFRNLSPMSHPMHVHNVQFQVFERSINGVPQELFDTDYGWKDTVLVRPGETVRILVRFQPDYTGTYLLHCHNLEHEDAGMMLNFELYAVTKTADHLQDHRSLRLHYDQLTRTLHLSFPPKAKGRMLAIYDLAGRCYKRYEIMPSQTSLALPLPLLPRGTYWVCLENWKHAFRIW